MAIYYNVVAKKNPLSDEVKYYAQIAKRNQVGFETLAEEIEKLTSLTAGDALNMLRTMQFLVIKHLQNCETVKFNELGTFIPSLSSNGTAKAADVSADMIKKVRVNFICGTALKNAFQFSSIEIRKYVPSA